MRRPLLVMTTALALLLTSGAAVTGQEGSPDPAFSPEPGTAPTPEQLAEAEERLVTATCLGKPATIVAIEGFETLGTADADIIVGTDSDDIIRGEGGNDRICAGDGADSVEGGDGKDRIDGGPGDDQLDGGASNDTISGGKGADMVLGSAGNDRLSGGRGGDTLDGGRGNDVCSGGPGHDWLPGCNEKNGTQGKLLIRQNTTLKGPHRGSIWLANDGISLDCGGYSVIGNGQREGLLIEDRRNVTVKNCGVTGFVVGISVSRSNRIALKRNHTYRNRQHGVSLYESHDNRLVSNVADGNGPQKGWGHGITLSRSRTNVLERNSASNNSHANYLLIQGSTGNAFRSNVASGSRDGFDVDPGRNMFIGNRSTGATSHGFKLDNTRKSKFIDNIVTGSRVGYFIGGWQNTFTGNAAYDNVSYGFEYEPSPGTNEFVDNSCFGNGIASSPDGLCEESPPEESPAETEPIGEPDPDSSPAVED